MQSSNEITDGAKGYTTIIKGLMRKEFMLEAVNDITDRVKDYKTIKLVFRSIDYYTVLLNGVLMTIDVKSPLLEGRNIITVPNKALKSNLTIVVELE